MCGCAGPLSADACLSVRLRSARSAETPVPTPSIILQRGNALRPIGLLLGGSLPPRPAENDSARLAPQSAAQGQSCVKAIPAIPPPAVFCHRLPGPTPNLPTKIIPTKIR